LCYCFVYEWWIWIVQELWFVVDFVFVIFWSFRAIKTVEVSTEKTEFSGKNYLELISFSLNTKKKHL